MCRCTLVWAFVLFLSAAKAFLQASPPDQTDSLEIAQLLSLYEEDGDTTWLLMARLQASTSTSPLGQALVDIAWGDHYAIMERTDQSLERYLNALKRIETDGNARQSSRVHSRLSNLLYRMLDFERAVKHGEQAVHYCRIIGDQRNLAITLSNLGSIYAASGRFDQSMSTHVESLQLALVVGDSAILLSSLNNLGSLNFDTENFLASRNYFERAYDLALRIEDSIEICRIGTNLAAVYGSLSQVQRSMQYLDNSAPYCHQADLALQGFRQRQQALALQESGRLQEAIRAYQHYIALSDQLHDEDRIQMATELSVRYETESKEQRIRILETEQQLQRAELSRQYILLASAALMLFSLALITGLTLRARRRSDYLLGNILPSAAVKELKRFGKVKTQKYPTVTIMFTDFVGFTAYTESLKPDELIERIDACYSAFDRIMESFGCEKIKTIGDAYMAVCGLPFERPDHAMRMAGAAFAIREYMYQFNQESHQRGFPELAIRIGLHTGEVIAGVVGLRKFAYDIWGRHVNLAARMEQSAEPNTINISESTFQRLKDQSTSEFRGELVVKGRDKMKMYYLTALQVETKS